MSFDGQAAFYDKMAVLSAGSIGVILSLLGAALSTKQSTLLLASSSRWIIPGALAFIFLSLVLSVAHNFLQLRTLAKEIPQAESVELQVRLGRAFDYGHYENALSVQAEADKWEQEKTHIRVLRGRNSKLGLTACLCFSGGYLLSIIWIVIGVAGAGSK